jgi:type II secretory pathway component GspD/PulD (secretin)
MKYFNILLVILIAFSANLSAQDKSSSTGSMQLKIDVSDDNGIDAITQIVTLHKLKASEIEPFIRARLSRYGAVHVNDATNTIIITDKPLKVKDLASLVLKLDETGSMNFLRLETEAIKLRNILPSTIRPYVLKRLSAEGSVDINDALNLLIITDLRSRIDNIKSFIPQFDILPKQLMVELKVYDITKLDSRSTGLDLFQLMKSAGGGASYSYYRYHNDGNASENASLQANVNLNYDELISYIEQNASNHKIVLASSPMVMVQNRNWGRISTNLNYYNNDDYYQRAYYSDQISFSVLPRISDSEIIELDVNIDFDNSSEASFDCNLDSYVTTSNDKTVLLGKISKKVETKYRSGIPYLKDIPVLGFFFGKEVKISEDHQFLVLATPHIYEAGSGMTDSLKTKE